MAEPFRIAVFCGRATVRSGPADTWGRILGSEERYRRERERESGQCIIKSLNTSNTVEAPNQYF